MSTPEQPASPSGHGPQPGQPSRPDLPPPSWTPAQPPGQPARAGQPGYAGQGQPPYPAQSGQPGQGAWVPASQAPMPARWTPLPVEPQPYHSFFRSPRWRWWRGLLALLMFGVITFAAMSVIGGIGYGIELARGTFTFEQLQANPTLMTPVLFLANNASLAAMIPAALLAAWACTGQRPRWLASIVAGFRWKWALTVAAVVLPFYVVYFAVSLLLDPGSLGELTWRPTSLLMIVGILLTTPLQAAGEEYGFRGLINRTVGSWFPHRTAGLIAGMVVSAASFAAMHAAQDIYLNTFYVLFGIMACLFVWRTGGLEAAVVLHVINNVTFMVGLPFSDITNMFDRSAGTGDPTVFIITAMQVVILIIVERLARKRGLPVSNAPAEAAWDAGATRPA